MPAVVEKVWGYEFGVDGVVRYAKACEIADISIDTLESYIADGVIRAGIHKGGQHRKGHRTVCLRSLREYIRSTERK